MPKPIYKFFRLILVFLFALSAGQRSVFADGGAVQWVQMVHGYRVALVFTNPVMVGENPLHIQVSYPHAMPVADAEVAVSVVAAPSAHAEAAPADTHGSAQTETDAHETMDMITLTPGHELGEYAGNLTIDQAGDLIIRAHLTIEGEVLEVDFPVTVVSPQNGFGLLVGFFAVNAVILSAAAVFKFKRVSAQPIQKA